MGLPKIFGKGEEGMTTEIRFNSGQLIRLATPNTPEENIKAMYKEYYTYMEYIGRRSKPIPSKVPDSTYEKFWNSDIVPDVESWYLKDHDIIDIECGGMASDTCLIGEVTVYHCPEKEARKHKKGYHGCPGVHCFVSLHFSHSSNDYFDALRCVLLSAHYDCHTHQMRQMEMIHLSRANARRDTTIRPFNGFGAELDDDLKRYQQLTPKLEWALSVLQQRNIEGEKLLEGEREGERNILPLGAC